MGEHAYAGAERQSGMRRDEMRMDGMGWNGMGWDGIDWQRCCKTRQSLRELDNQSTFMFVLFSAVTMADGPVRPLVRDGEP